MYIPCPQEMKTNTEKNCLQSHQPFQEELIELTNISHVLGSGGWGSPMTLSLVQPQFKIEKVALSKDTERGEVNPR